LGRPIFIIANTTEFLPFALQRFPHAQGILEDSLDLAERGRLASGLIEARNRFVHGGP
jgi:hypothetical protein